MDNMGVERIMKQRNKIMFIMLPVIMLLLMTGCSFDKKKLEDKALDKAEEMVDDAFDKASDIVDKALDKATGDDENSEEDIGEFPRLKEGAIPDSYIQAEADRVAGVMRDGFIAKDADIVKELFSEYAHEQYDLDTQIADVFEFIDGEIVSVGKILAGCSGFETTMEYGSVINEIDGTIDEVVTDNGKSYSISFKGYYNYKSHDEQVGVYSIHVVDDAAYNVHRGGIQPGGDISIGRIKYN